MRLAEAADRAGSLRLDDRINLLSRAVVAAQSAGVDRAVSDEIADKLDVARLQKQIVASLNNEPAAAEKLQEQLYDIR